MPGKESKQTTASNRAEAEGRKKQPEKLLEVVSRSQRGFRDLIDSFDHIAFNISLDGQVRVINRRFAESLGLPFTEIVNHPIQEFVVEPTRAEIERSLPGFLEKRSWSGVLRVRWRRTSEVRFYDCSLYAVVKNGAVLGACGLARDISGRREAESRFTQLFETLEEGVYFSTPEGALLDANPALVRMLGYRSREELLAMNARALYWEPGQREKLLAEVDRERAVRNREIVLRRQDGTPIDCLDNCSAIRDTSGQVIRYQGTLVDISDRRKMERRLREEQEFVRRLVACFPDIIAVLDAQGRYTYVSPRVEDLLGYSRDEMLGLLAGDRAHPEDRPAVTQTIKDLISGKANHGAVEYRAFHKDGHVVHLRVSAAPLYDAEGRIAGVVASGRDVTESKKLEQQLLQSEKLAAIGQMVAGVAHELNNPLTAILGVSELLRERLADDASRRQAELIQKQARKAANLVQDLLSFSRPSRPKNQKVRVEELIARALEIQKASLSNRKIVVEISAAKELPDVAADPHQLVQVFVNLLTNAEQAIASVREHGAIRIQLGQAGGNVEILFEDDGPGIPPELRGKIFDPFFTTRRAVGGAGLGLAICLVILKEHGGTIEAQPAPNGGARFRISLPFPAASLAVSPEATPEPRASASRGRAVLVVDDEEAIRELIREGLSARGFEVDAAESSEAALSKLSRRKYDAVLCDVNLVGESGQQVYETVRARAGELAPRFVFITGDLLDPGRLAALEQAGARILPKPFQLAQLLALLEEVLGPPAGTSE